MSLMDVNRESLKGVLANIRSVYYGDPQVIRKIFISLLSGGHILLEDVPGVGKTILARALAASIDCSCNRIQLTPDLLPSDITGVSIYNRRTSAFEFKKGPIFANIVLADEINRTTPRTQSALLEAMCENQVSVDGRAYPLPKPFMVLATQNPFEFEGTYFLPENQLDRFLMRIRVGYPDREQEKQILALEPSENVLTGLKPAVNVEQIIALQQHVRKVEIDGRLTEYIMDIITASRNHPDLLVGASPRAALALQRVAKASAVLSNRDYCLPDDIKSFAMSVLSHRIISKKFSHEPTRQSCDNIMEQILNSVPVPG
ncbi:MAG: MoxR family ATPase [Sedimentisphaerales bacterium]|nr:MoxR family ATPase [Sedimentisphaerales bacterium]